MRCRWTSTWRYSVLWNLLVVRSFWTWTLGLCGRAAMWRILGRCSTRIPLAHHRFCPKLLCSGELLNLVNLSSHDHIWFVGSRSSLQGIIQNLKIRKPLRARDWRLLRHQSKTIVSMKNLPSQLFSLHRSHLIVRLSTFQICRTSVSKWDLFLYFWWNANCLSNSSHEYRCFQCRRHKHSPC